MNFLIRGGIVFDRPISAKSRVETLLLSLSSVHAQYARFFAPLGIQTYGFIPMRLPSDFKFLQLIHAADERVPVSALEFGTEAIFRALQRF